MTFVDIPRQNKVSLYHDKSQKTVVANNYLSKILHLSKIGRSMTKQELFFCHLFQKDKLYVENRLHTAVILATTAVAPLSLEAFRLPACLGGQAEKAAPYAAATQLNKEEASKPESRKSNFLSQLFSKKKKETPKHCFESSLAQQATVITSENNQADARTATISSAAKIQEQIFSTPHTSEKSLFQNHLALTASPTSSDTSSLSSQPEVKKENTGNVTDNKAPTSPANAPTNTPSPAPRPMTELFADPLNLLASVSADIEQPKNHKIPPQTTEACVDSIRFSKILEGLKPFFTSPQQSSLDMISEAPEAKPDIKKQAAQLKAELASLSESSEEAQQHKAEEQKGASTPTSPEQAASEAEKKPNHSNGKTESVKDPFDVPREEMLTKRKFDLPTRPKRNHKVTSAPKLAETEVSAESK